MRRHPLDPIALVGGLVLAGIGLLAVLDPERTSTIDLTLVVSGGIAVLGLTVLLASLRRRGAPDR